jgi:membrane-bound serine protease (ClpP class)
MAVKLRRRPVVSGQEEMLTSVGEVLQAFETRGQIRIHGELWDAVTSQPLTAGQRVRVKAVDGLTLKVEPLAKEK